MEEVVFKMVEFGFENLAQDLAPELYSKVKARLEAPGETPDEQ
jgi:hypothetical protein